MPRADLDNGLRGSASLVTIMIRVTSLQERGPCPDSNPCPQLHGGPSDVAYTDKETESQNGSVRLQLSRSSVADGGQGVWLGHSRLSLLHSPPLLGGSVNSRIQMESLAKSPRELGELSQENLGEEILTETLRTRLFK